MLGQTVAELVMATDKANRTTLYSYQQSCEVSVVGVMVSSVGGVSRGGPLPQRLDPGALPACAVLSRSTVTPNPKP